MKIEVEEIERLIKENYGNELPPYSQLAKSFKEKIISIINGANCDEVDKKIITNYHNSQIDKPQYLGKNTIILCQEILEKAGDRELFKGYEKTIVKRTLHESTKELLFFVLKGERKSVEKVNDVLKMSNKVKDNQLMGSDITRANMFLNPMSRVVSTKNIFFRGRIEELKKMDDLVRKNNLVLVTGVRGGGKTTFVNKFVSTHINDFSNVLYVNVKSGHVTESVIQAFKEGNLFYPQEMGDQTKIPDLLMQLIDKLTKLSFDRPLLIIDSANAEPSLKYFINEWQKHDLDWKIIITTSLTAIEIKDAKNLKLPDLDEKSAQEIFDNFVKRDLSADMKQAAMQVFHDFKYNPILCELLSKLIQSNLRIDTEQLHDLKALLKRKAEQPSTINSEVAAKFESNEEMTIVQYISSMFLDIASTLRESEREILRYLSILPARPMQDERLLQLLPITEQDLEIIDSLVNKGWLLRNEQNSIYCHELYQLAIQHLFKPDVINCHLLIDKIEKLIRLNELDDMEKDVVGIYIDYLPVAIEIANNLIYDKQFIDHKDERFAQKIIECVNNTQKNSSPKPSFNDSSTYALLLYNISEVYQVMSYRSDAIQFAFNSLQMTLRVSGQANYLVGRNLAQIAFLINKLGNAEQAYQLLEVSKQVYDEDLETPEILKTRLLITLGNTCRDMGYTDNAIRYLTKSIEECEKNEKFDFDRATAMDNLGFVYSYLGKKLLIEKDEDDVTGIELCRTSIKWREDALKLREKIHTNKENLKTALLYSNIGAIQAWIKNFNESLASYNHCLRIREEQKLPENHTSMAIIKNNIATTYAKMVYYDSTLSREQRLDYLLVAYRLSNESERIKIFNYGEKNYNVAPSYYTKGLISLLFYRSDNTNKRSLDEAKIFAEKSLELRKTHIPNINHEVRESEKLIDEIINELKKHE